MDQNTFVRMLETTGEAAAPRPMENQEGIPVKTVGKFAEFCTLIRHPQPGVLAQLGGNLPYLLHPEDGNREDHALNNLGFLGAA